MAALLANPIARNVLITAGIFVAEKTTLYIVQRFKRSREAKINAKLSSKLDGVEEGETGEEICPICRQKLEVENNNEQDPCQEPQDGEEDIDNGTFILPQCKHKFHYKCLRKWRLIYKKCAVCSL